MALDFDALCSGPEYLLNDLNLDTAEAVFIKLDKGALRRSVFMDNRLKTSMDVMAHVPLLQLQNVVGSLKRRGAATLPINYILHSAFCCSTLVSRCLDIENICCSMREPWVLMQMANYRRLNDRYRVADGEWRALLDTALFLLAKCHAPQETVLIKLPNAANNLSEDLLEHPRTGGVLLLYSSLEQFLVSILKKGEAGRKFVRRLFNVVRMDSQQTNRMDFTTLSDLTDLQIAAFTWYLQMDSYLRLLERFPHAHIRTLDCETFLAQPEDTLIKLSGLFRINTGTDKLKQIIGGPAFRKSSKDETQEYDAATRGAEYADITRQHGADIRAILTWSEGIRPEGPVSLPLPARL